MENWRQIKTELADREGHLYTFTDKARTLMFEGRYSDIILYNSKDFTDTKFYFNKLVLASLSGYFATFGMNTNVMAPKLKGPKNQYLGMAFFISTFFRICLRKGGLKYSYI